MELTASRKQLLQAIEPYAAISEGAKMVGAPMMDQILLGFHDGEFEVQGGTQELFYQVNVRDETIQTGEVGLIGVLCRDFRQLIQGMADKPICLQQDNALHQAKLVISSGKIHFKLNTLQPESLPEFYPEMGETELIGTFTAGFLNEMWGSVLAVGKQSKSKKRVEEYGIRVEKAEDCFRLVATDGHRLVLADGEPPSQNYGDWGLSSLESGMTFPLVFVERIRSLIAKLEPDTPCSFMFAWEPEAVSKLGSRYLLLQCKTPTIEYKLAVADNTYARYPEYKPIVFAPAEHYYVLSQHLFLEALRRLNTMTNTIELFFGDGPDIIISGLRNGVRFSQEYLFVVKRLQAARKSGYLQAEDTSEVPLVGIGADLSFLIDAVASMQSQRVAMGISNTISSMFIEPYRDPEEERTTRLAKHIHVLMPMRVSGGELLK